MNDPHDEMAPHHYHLNKRLVKKVAASTITTITVLFGAFTVMLLLTLGLIMWFVT